MTTVVCGRVQNLCYSYYPWWIRNRINSTTSETIPLTSKRMPSMSKNSTLPSVSNTRKLTHTFSNIFDNKESQFTRPTTDVVPDTLCRFWNISRGSEACSYFYEPLALDEDPDKYSFAVCFICSKGKYTCLLFTMLLLPF